MYSVECEKVVGDGSHAGVVYTLSTASSGCSPRVMHRVFHRGGADFFEGKVIKVAKVFRVFSDLNDSNEGNVLRSLGSLKTLKSLMTLKTLEKKWESGEGLQEKSPKAMAGLGG